MAQAIRRTQKQILREHRAKRAQMQRRENLKTYFGFALLCLAGVILIVCGAIISEGKQSAEPIVQSAQQVPIEVDHLVERTKARLERIEAKTR